MKKIATIGAAIVFATAVVLGQGGASPEVQLKAAIHKEQVEGDLQGAAEQFRKLAQSPNRAVAAQAYVHLGQCYEKIGDAQAREATSAYEKVVRDFADQKDAVAEARRHLAARGPARTIDAGLVDRLAWTPPVSVTAGKLSADGRNLVFIDWQVSQKIGLHDLVTGEDRVVAENTGCVAVVRSPDGRLMACSTAFDGPDGGRVIEILPTNGSAARRQLTMKDPVSLEDWSPDGTSLLARTRRGAAWDLVVVSVADGATRVLKSGGGVGPRGRSPNAPRFSPDGRYVVHPASPPPSAEGVLAPTRLHVLSLVDGSEAPLVRDGATEADWCPVWTPDGRRIVFLSDRSGQPAIWAVRVADGKPQGDPEMLKTEDGSTVLFGIARDGTLYCERYRSSIDVYAAEIDTAAATVLAERKRVNQSFVGRSNGPMAWSPDGKWLAFSRFDATKRAIVLHAMDTGQERELPETPGRVVGWFPDGQSLLVGPPFRRVRVDTGQSQPVPGLERANLGSFGTAIALSHDGKTLYYAVSDFDAAKNAGPNTYRLIRRRLETGEEQELYRAQSVELHSFRVSPDDRLVAFGERGATATVLKVVPADGGIAREVYARSAWGVEWSRDGRSLIARGSANGGVQLVVVPLDGSPVRQTGLRLSVHLALAPDGRRLAFALGEDISEIFAVRNLLTEAKAMK